jgi:hypothetical protein
VPLFTGFEVGQPNAFYLSRDTTFQQFEADVQTAVNVAKHTLSGYVPVNFIEFYDVDIASNFTLPNLDGSMSSGSSHVNNPLSANNDDPGGFMYVPLTDAHASFRGAPQNAQPVIARVANAEGEAPTIAPNSWVEVKGLNLAPAGDSRIWQSSDFGGNTMPTQLVHVR